MKFDKIQQYNRHIQFLTISKSIFSKYISDHFHSPKIKWFFSRKHFIYIQLLYVEYLCIETEIGNYCHGYYLVVSIFVKSMVRSRWNGTAIAQFVPIQWEYFGVHVVVVSDIRSFFHSFNSDFPFWWLRVFKAFHIIVQLKTCFYSLFIAINHSALLIRLFFFIFESM